MNERLEIGDSNIGEQPRGEPSGPDYAKFGAGLIHLNPATVRAVLESLRGYGPRGIAVGGAIAGLCYVAGKFLEADSNTPTWGFIGGLVAAMMLSALGAIGLLDGGRQRDKDSEQKQNTSPESGDERGSARGSREPP